MKPRNKLLHLTLLHCKGGKHDPKDGSKKRAKRKQATLALIQRELANHSMANERLHYE